MKCPNCGNETDNGMFCSVCGTRLDTQQAAPESHATPGYNASPMPPAGPYAAPQYAAPQYAPRPVDDKPLTTGQFFLMDLLMIIPLANIILLFVWAFGNENLNRKSWARARLIWILVGIVITILLSIMLASVFATLGSELQYYFKYM